MASRWKLNGLCRNKYLLFSGLTLFLAPAGGLPAVAAVQRPFLHPRLSACEGRPPLLSLTHLEGFNKRRSALKYALGRDLPGFRLLFVGNWCVFLFPLRWEAPASDSGVASVFYFISHHLMLVT